MEDTIDLIIKIPMDVYKRIINDDYDGDKAKQATDDIYTLLLSLDNASRVAIKCKECAYYRGD